MNLTELKSLVKRGEGLHLEFKKKADHPEKIVRELVAFANTQGGVLLLGVDDYGNLSGLKFPDEDVYVMEAAIHLYAKPNLPIQTQIIPIGTGLSVILFEVKSGLEKPYYWLLDKEKQIFKAYVRHKDQSLKASKEMFQILRFQPENQIKRPFQVKDLERKVLSFLGEHEKITLAQFCEVAKIPVWKASKILVSWVKQGVLEISPGEDFDVYTLTEAYSDLV
jgi:hypothetical protein